MAKTLKRTKREPIRSAGWDIFTPDPNQIKSMKCRICDAEMDVERGVVGPRGFAAALGGIKSAHDVFACPNSGEDWHNQVLDLQKAINESPSRFAVDQMTREIGYILKDRKPTLSRYSESVKMAEELRQKLEKP